MSADVLAVTLITLSFHHKREIFLICLSFSTRPKFSAVNYNVDFLQCVSSEKLLLSNFIKQCLYLQSFQKMTSLLRNKLFAEVQSPRSLTLETALLYSESVIFANWSCQITADNKTGERLYHNASSDRAALVFRGDFYHQ